MEKEKKALMSKLYEYEETTKRAERGETPAEHKIRYVRTKFLFTGLTRKTDRRMWFSDAKLQRAFLHASCQCGFPGFSFPNNVRLKQKNKKKKRSLLGFESSGDFLLSSFESAVQSCSVCSLETQRKSDR